MNFYFCDVCIYDETELSVLLMVSPHSNRLAGWLRLLELRTVWLQDCFQNILASSLELLCDHMAMLGYRCPIGHAGFFSEF